GPAGRGAGAGGAGGGRAGPRRGRRALAAGRPAAGPAARAGAGGGPPARPHRSGQPVDGGAASLRAPLWAAPGSHVDLGYPGAMTSRRSFYPTIRAVSPWIVRAVVLTLGGLWLMRRFVPVAVLRESNDAVGNYLQTIGTIYAVLL